MKNNYVFAAFLLAALDIDGNHVVHRLEDALDIFYFNPFDLQVQMFDLLEDVVQVSGSIDYDLDG